MESPRRETSSLLLLQFPDDAIPSFDWTSAANRAVVRVRAGHEARRAPPA